MAGFWCGVKGKTGWDAVAIACARSFLVAQFLERTIGNQFNQLVKIYALIVF